MPYNGAKVKRDRAALAQAIIRAKTQGMDYGDPLIEWRQTSGYGPRVHPVTGKPHMHTGVDLAAAQGDPVFATEDGVITQAQHHSGSPIRGNQVTVKHADGRETRYQHLERFGEAALKGGRVRKGDVLGYVGRTGRATGPHLHYGMYEGGRPRNPFG